MPISGDGPIAMEQGERSEQKPIQLSPRLLSWPPTCWAGPCLSAFRASASIIDVHLIEDTVFKSVERLSMAHKLALR